MSRLVAALSAVFLALGLLVSAPTATAVPAGVSVSVAVATPRPGQFCKRVDRGVLKSSPYGRLKCKADPKNSSWSRWYHA